MKIIYCELHRSLDHFGILVLHWHTSKSKKIIQTRAPIKLIDGGIPLGTNYRLQMKHQRLKFFSHNFRFSFDSCCFTIHPDSNFLFLVHGKKLHSCLLNNEKVNYSLCTGCLNEILGIFSWMSLMVLLLKKWRVKDVRQ